MRQKLTWFMICCKAASNAVLEMRESPERDRNVRLLLVSEQHVSAETFRRLAFDASAW